VVTIVKEVPVPVESGDTWAYYEDEHKDEWVHISIADTIRNNRIAWREWEYELFVPLHILHTTTITERVPYPYPVKEEVHFSWYGGASFGTDGWRARGGKVYERWLFGVYAGRSMGDNVVGVEVSVMF